VRLLVGSEVSRLGSWVARAWSLRFRSGIMMDWSVIMLGKNGSMSCSVSMNCYYCFYQKYVCGRTRLRASVNVVCWFSCLESAVETK
jgi:hypothetical protein